MILRTLLLSGFTLTALLTVVGCNKDDDEDGANAAAGGDGGRGMDEGGAPTTGGTMPGEAGAGGDPMMGTGGTMPGEAGAGGDPMMGTGGTMPSEAGAGGDPRMGTGGTMSGGGGAAGATEMGGAAGAAEMGGAAGATEMGGAAGATEMGGAAGATAFRLHIENVAAFDHLESGAFTTAVGASEPGPLAPGEAFEFTFAAGPHHRLSFATMFGQSNDWFFAPADGSLALYDGDTPLAGDITDRIALWDAGTEVDEEPAVGPHTGPLQATSMDGPGADDPDDTVRPVPDPAPLTDGGTFDRPAVADLIRVTVTSDATTRQFSVRIENVAEDGVTLQTSDGGKPVRVSPGVWSVGDQGALLFEPGAPDRGLGLEAIAEGGDVSVLSAALAPTAGVATPLSPGLIVLHDGGEPLFTEGAADRGLGLERLAETGNPGDLADAFAAALPVGASSFTVFNTPVGATDPAPIHAGEAFDVDFAARPGDRLSLATMYGASNDWIFAFEPDGVALFAPDGIPAVGDLTSSLSLWDVGTELSEEPAVGAFIGGPEGPVDPDSMVRLVDADEYPIAPDRHLRVTLSTR